MAYQEAETNRMRAKYQIAEIEKRKETARNQEDVRKAEIETRKTKIGRNHEGVRKAENTIYQKTEIEPRNRKTEIGLETYQKADMGMKDEAEENNEAINHATSFINISRARIFSFLKMPNS